MKQVYYFGVGSLHNDESSVDGGKYIRLPLMQAMMKAGLDITWLGFERNEQVVCHYLDLLNIKKQDYIIDLRNSVKDYHSKIVNAAGTHIKEKVVSSIIDTKPGILFIELRPNIDKTGYNFVNEFAVQKELIELFYSKKLPIFVWDQDVWAEQMPNNLKKKVVLLRSYFEHVNGFDKQEEFLYGWSFFDDMEMKLYALQHRQAFDVSYCGNVYGRRDEFLEFFKPFEEQKKKVCIQGNWLRKKYDDRDFALDNFPSFMFFGRTPHWSTLPSIALSKSVIQFSNPDQQKVGLPTARIFETLMGHSVVFCSNKIKHIDKIIPEELIFTSADDLLLKWNRIDKDKSWANMRKKFEDKLLHPGYSYNTRVKELLSYVKKYYL